MFEALTKGFREAQNRLAGLTELDEKNIKPALREVRLSLLEADVELGVVKRFLARVEEKAIGQTLRYREYLWDLGLGVAEAMDTAQRGMGLDWNGARELIRHALEAAKSRPGVKIACGVGTDHLAPGANVTVDDVIRAYEEQIEAIEAMGGRLVVMASRARPAEAAGAMASKIPSSASEWPSSSPAISSA